VTRPPSTEWQLRDYRIEPGRFDEFIAAWRVGVVPVRRQFGFRIRAWAIPEEDRFVWVLAYSGPGSFADAERAYHASEARTTVEPDPGRWVVEKRNIMVTPVVTEE
jgi:hypothetical protein